MIPNGSYRSLLVEGLIENTTYLYSVRAENQAGYGPWQQAKMLIDHKVGTRPPSTVFLDEQGVQSYMEQQTKEEQKKKTQQVVVTKPQKKKSGKKVVESTDVTTRITRHLRAKGGKPAEKEVTEYPGRLSREEIEKLASGCERVEVNVMTRSLKKTVPVESGASSSSAVQSSGTSGGQQKVTKTEKKTKEGGVTTITRTIKTTSSGGQQQKSSKFSTGSGKRIVRK